MIESIYYDHGIIDDYRDNMVERLSWQYPPISYVYATSSCCRSSSHDFREISPTTLAYQCITYNSFEAYHCWPLQFLAMHIISYTNRKNVTEE